jgi:hypothetical protein
LRAHNLRELVDNLKKSPDVVIYYHTHHFMEQHQNLVPELTNDFANWVNDALGNERLAEKLASVSTLDYLSLDLFRDKLVEILEENITSNSHLVNSPPGREFHFIKLVSVVLPTDYVARDLREFVEALRKISQNSLNLHVFESRLRFGRASNDFTYWLENNLDEPELGREVAAIDPYTFTLEGLRSLLIQVIEKRIK